MNRGRYLVSHCPEAGAPIAPALRFILLRLGNQLAKHIWKDTTVLVIIYLDRGIDPESDRHLLRVAVGAVNDESHILTRTDFAIETGNVEGLAAVPC